MIRLKTQVLLFSIVYSLLAILRSTITSIDNHLNDIVYQFIGQDIRNNETLLNEVKMALDHVWLQTEYQHLQLRRKDEIIATKFSEWDIKEDRLRNKSKYFFWGLSIFKAATLIDSIEEKLFVQSKEPKLCDRCLKWGHTETNCTDIRAKSFLGYENVTRELKKDIYIKMNRWYWTLEHRRDDVHIARLSDHLEKVYSLTNFTASLPPKEKPENIEQFKLTFCLALMQIQKWWYNEKQPFFSKNVLIELGAKKVSLYKYTEIFFSAVGRWVSFEEYMLRYRGDNSTAETTRPPDIEKNQESFNSEIFKILKIFIGEDIRTNETLLHEVKSAIEHVLTENQRLKIQVSIKDEIIRRKTKEMEADCPHFYEKKLKTISDELWIYKITKRIKKPLQKDYNEEYPPLCSNCLTRNHTADRCDSSKVTLGNNDSISDVYNWYLKLDHPERDFEIALFLKVLKKSYDKGNFTRKLKPKPGNLQQLKLMFCKALDEIHRYVNYSTSSCCNEPQLKERYLYGVPLHEYAKFTYMGGEFPNQLALNYDYEESESESESDLDI